MHVFGRLPSWAIYAIAGTFGGCITILVMATGNLEDVYQRQASLLKQIQQDTKRTSPFSGVEQIDERVLQAMGNTPRHEFVDDSLTWGAYLNRPLPIGHGQTISQPFIVALMTHLAEVKNHHKVLEIGTGSGYQAAVLSELVATVYTVEIIPELATEAMQRLNYLGYDNINVKIADGSFGWATAAAYDAIIVTAASETVPQALLEQLSAPGKLVIPLGEQDGAQELFVYSKNGAGEVTRTSHLPVSFVPFTGAQSEDN